MWATGTSSLSTSYGLPLPDRSKPTMSSNAAPNPVVPFSPTYQHHHHHQLSRDRIPRFSKQSILHQRDPDVFEPAIDGPPSPEALRRLNRQMKRASHLHRRPGHYSRPSNASITSFGLDLEQALDNIDLVRNDSRFSEEGNDSFTHARDLSEGIQALGKNLFHRRGRSKQEATTTSTTGSSGSSMYSSDVPMDSSLVNTKESLMTSLFSRRKPSREEPPKTRVQISTPFNFQHVTHTNRDNIGEELWEADELAVQPVQPIVGRRRAASKTEMYHHSNPSSAFGSDTDLSQPTRPALVPRHTTGFAGVRKFMKTSGGRSMDLNIAQANGTPPPRPPRSPLEPAPTSVPMNMATPSSPPPRVASLHPSQYGAYQAPASPPGRPQTSNGFQSSRPFSPSSPLDSIPSSPCKTPTSVKEVHSAPWPADLFMQPPPINSEPAWPLASPTITTFQQNLSMDFGESGSQHHIMGQPAGVSHVSNSSSLRPSRSVPMLRAMAQAEVPPISSQSQMNLSELVQECELARESWEDDIDYAYEHEVEADCDYHWERPSMDVPRPEEFATAGAVQSMDQVLRLSNGDKHVDNSPSMLSTSSFDVPALSPTSHYSNTPVPEAATPTVFDSMSNSFSLPKTMSGKTSRMSLMKYSNRSSQLSEIQEAEGYEFSSSMDDDYHHALLSVDQGCRSPATPPDRAATALASHDDEDLTGLHSQRASTATTASNYSTDSSSVGERHISTNSNSTALTRHTASSTSLTKLTGPWELDDTPPPVPTKDIEEPEEVEQSSEEQEEEASQDTVPEMKPLPMLPSGARSLHKTHASTSVVPVDFQPMTTQEAERPVRARARTSSLTRDGFPVGQFALFPRPMVGSRNSQVLSRTEPCA